MRKSVYILLLVVFAVFVFGLNASFGQCPGCIINMSCTASPAKPTLCPAVMPDGTAMVPYSEDVSFYLPHNFDDAGSGFNVDLNEVDVLNVSGMPYGLNFQCDASPSNIYYPTQNPPTTEHGCGKICGTPIIAGTYNITVFVLAHVTVTSLGISQTSNTSFSIPLTILPNSTANSLFSINNPLGCAPLSTGFQNLMPSNGHPGYSYIWNFGNGNMSNLENPPVQNYNTPGNYPVSLQTVIDTIGYFLIDVTVLGHDNSCSDLFDSPDFYFILLLGGNTVYQSNYVDNTDSPVSIPFTATLQLSNSTYTLQIWDYDTGLYGGDDLCNNPVTFNGYNAGTHTLTNGALSVSITINHPTITLSATDTVKVFPSPVVSNISFAPNDSVCDKDSIILSITPVTGCTYQWYRDTAAIYNATNNSYTAMQSGLYYCEVMNTYGCRTNTNNQKITFMPNPPKPTFWIVGNTLNTNLTGYHLQWYFAGNAITGATGMSCNVTATGNYFVLASTDFGCFTSSDTISATYIGIPENQQNTAFRLFPNPNRGTFAVELDIQGNKDVIVQVTDLLGKVIYEEDLGTQTGFLHKDVDLNPVSTGIYIVTINVGGVPVHQRMSIH